MKHIEIISFRFIYACNSASRILCPSQYVYDGILEISPQSKDKLYLCEYGYSGSLLDSNDEKPKLSNQFNISWIGRDSFRKGLDVFLALSNEKYVTDKKLVFHTAGLQLKNPTIFPNVVDHGKLPFNLTMDLFHKTHLFILPSLSEGFASVIVEALMNGCLVITTESSGISQNKNLPGLIVLKDFQMFFNALSDFVNLSQMNLLVTQI